MSYSFSVRASTKAEAEEKVVAELTEVVKSQPIHKADWEQAHAAAESLIALLRDDETQDILVSVSGSCWCPQPNLESVGVPELNSVGLHIDASLSPKQDT